MLCYWPVRACCQAVTLRLRCPGRGTDDADDNNNGDLLSRGVPVVGFVTRWRIIGIDFAT